MRQDTNRPMSRQVCFLLDNFPWLCCLVPERRYLSSSVGDHCKSLSDNIQRIDYGSRTFSEKEQQVGGMRPYLKMTIWISLKILWILKLTPSVPNTIASKNAKSAAYTNPFTLPYRNPGTLSHITSAITAQSHMSHFVTYVEAAEASSERNGIQFARSKNKNLLMMAIGERKVDVVGTTEEDSVVL